MTSLVRCSWCRWKKAYRLKTDRIDMKGIIRCYNCYRAEVSGKIKVFKIETRLQKVCKEEGCDDIYLERDVASFIMKGREMAYHLFYIARNVVKRLLKEKGEDIAQINV